jgi:hypothetical protein
LFFFLDKKEPKNQESLMLATALAATARQTFAHAPICLTYNRFHIFRSNVFLCINENADDMQWETGNHTLRNRDTALNLMITRLSMLF